MARPRRSITAFGPAMMGGLRSSGRPLRPLVKSKPRSPRRRLRLRTVTTALAARASSQRIVGDALPCRPALSEHTGFAGSDLLPKRYPEAKILGAISRRPHLTY